MTTDDFFDWDNAEPRERDAWIAEHVMELEGVGWYRRVSCHSMGYERCGKDDCTRDFPQWKASLYYMGDDGQPTTIPAYTTNVAADYKVLEKIRTWPNGDDDPQPKECYASWQLRQIFNKRDPQSLPEDNVVEYRPGDYSEAAFRTFEADHRLEQAELDRKERVIVDPGGLYSWIVRNTDPGPLTDEQYRYILKHMPRGDGLRNFYTREIEAMDWEAEQRAKLSP